MGEFMHQFCVGNNSQLIDANTKVFNAFNVKIGAVGNAIWKLPQAFPNGAVIAL